MKIQSDILQYPERSHPAPRPLPSSRVPVTTANRDLLRWLRAAELCAWEDADRTPRRIFRRLPHPATGRSCFA